jgi:hypothetical protein
MRLDTCPLLVIQPKQTRAHSLAPRIKNLRARESRRVI